MQIHINFVQRTTSNAFNSNSKSPYSVFLSVVSLAGTLRFDVSYGEQEVLGTSLTDKYRVMIETDCTQIFILRHSSTSRE